MLILPILCAAPIHSLFYAILIILIILVPGLCFFISLFLFTVTLSYFLTRLSHSLNPITLLSTSIFSTYSFHHFFPYLCLNSFIIFAFPFHCTYTLLIFFHFSSAIICSLPRVHWLQATPIKWYNLCSINLRRVNFLDHGLYFPQLVNIFTEYPIFE